MKTNCGPSAGRTIEDLPKMPITKFVPDGKGGIMLAEELVDAAKILHGVPADSVPDSVREFEKYRFREFEEKEAKEMKTMKKAEAQVLPIGKPVRIDRAVNVPASAPVLVPSVCNGGYTMLLQGLCTHLDLNIMSFISTETPPAAIPGLYRITGWNGKYVRVDWVPGAPQSARFWVWAEHDRRWCLVSKTESVEVCPDGCTLPGYLARIKVRMNVCDPDQQPWLPVSTDVSSVLTVVCADDAELPEGCTAEEAYTVNKAEKV